MWSIALSLLALAPVTGQSSQPAKAPVIPLALPTTQDYALVALAPTATGSATVTMKRRGETDQLDCAPTDIVGGTSIAVASCTLIMMKMGWMAALKRSDGNGVTVPVLRVLWEPAPASFDSDYGGATPLAIDGMAPTQSTGAQSNATRSHYATRIDATGRSISCRITASSGTSDHDETACLVAMGQRYLPALNAQGEPVATQVRSWVRFVDRE